MHTRVEQYVYDVIRRLPERDRERVKAELTAKINSMLSNDPTDEDIDRVLSTLGSTSEMADQYRVKKRFLISPALYDDYLHTLRIVGFILFAVILTISLLVDIFAIFQKPSISDLLSAIFVSCLKSIGIAAVASFTSVTITFALIDHFNQNRNWTTNSLPKMPRQVRRIPRRSVAVSMVTSILLNIVWVVAMMRYSGYIAWYDHGSPSVALFHADILLTMVPFVIALAVGSFLVSIGKLVYGYWNFPLAALNAVYDLGNAVYFVYFFHSGVFNEAFIAKVASAVSVSKDVAIVYFDKGVFILCAIFIIAMIWDAADCFYRAFRNRNAGMETQ